MKLTEPEDRQGWVKVVRLVVTDAEPMNTSAYGGGQFVPTEARIIYQGGSFEPVIVRLRGPMMRPDGSLSRRMAQGRWPSTKLMVLDIQQMVDKHRPEWM